MASKLFRAVVGVGISLGSAACGGSTDYDSVLVQPDAGALPETGVDAGVQQPKPFEAGAPDASSPSDAGVIDATPDAAPEAAVVDASVSDAAEDAPSDAIVAAFCDRTWPITKSGREACGPIDECMGKAIPWCYGPGQNGPCTLIPLECVNGEWGCMGGVQPSSVDIWEDPKCQ